MIHKSMPLSAVFIYGAKSLGLFALLIAGIFVALMIARAVDDMKN